WSPGEPGKIPPPPPEPPRAPSLVSPTLFAIVASVAVAVLTALLLLWQRPTLRGAPLPSTIADVSAVHAHVRSGGSDVRGTERVVPDSIVETDEDGRGRVRLDDGTVLILDRATRLRVSPGRVSIEKGRSFVLGVLGARTLIGVPGMDAVVSGANVGFECG